MAVLSAAVVLGVRATIITTACGAGVVHFGGHCGQQRVGSHPHPDQSVGAYALTPAELGYAILSNIVALVVVGALSAGSRPAIGTGRGGTGTSGAGATDRSSPDSNEDIVSSLGSGLLTTTDQGVVTSLNDPGAHILGLPASELMGRSIERTCVGVYPSTG